MTNNRPGRTRTAQEAQQLHLEVQLCREMGWTRDQLYAQDEEFVWAITTILSAEGQKMKRNTKPPSR